MLYWADPQEVISFLNTGEIDENDFDQIYPEIVNQEQLRKSEDDQKGLSYGVMREQMLMTQLDKEIARSERYKTSLSALGFTLVKVKAKQNLPQNQIKTRVILDALLRKLVKIFRTPDIIGEMGKNNFIVLLPMTDQGQANLALRRAMKILHLSPLKINKIAFEIKVAGVVADMNFIDTINAKLLVEHLTSQIKDMAMRISNLHANS